MKPLILPTRPGDVDTIVDVVARSYGLAPVDIMGTRRQSHIVAARHVAQYLARRITGMSFPELGRAFNRDHSTIIHGWQRVDNERKRNPNIDAFLDEIEAQCSPAEESREIA